MFQYVDVVIAFAALILLASLFITAATQVVISLLGLRGANLRRGLATLCVGGGQGAALLLEAE